MGEGEKVFLSIVFLGVLMLVGVTVFGFWSLHEEQVRIENMSPEEHQAYEESIAEEDAKQAAAQEENRKLNQTFNEEMKRFESDGVKYEGGKRGSHAKFLLTEVGMKTKFVFGEQLPSGKKASLYMSGRGSSGSGQKGQQLADWHKAGQYGIYHYEGRDIYYSANGDFIEFENLSQVEVTIYF